MNEQSYNEQNHHQSTGEEGAVVVFLAITFSVVALCCAIAVDYSNFLVNSTRARRAAHLATVNAAENLFVRTFDGANASFNAGGNDNNDPVSGGTGVVGLDSGGAGAGGVPIQVSLEEWAENHRPEMEGNSGNGGEQEASLIDIYQGQVPGFLLSNYYASKSAPSPITSPDESLWLSRGHEIISAANRSAANSGASPLRLPQPGLVARPNQGVTGILARLNANSHGLQEQGSPFVEVGVSSRVAPDIRTDVTIRDQMPFLSSFMGDAALTAEYSYIATRTPLALSMIVDHSGSSCQDEDPTGTIVDRHAFPNVQFDRCLDGQYCFNPEVPVISGSEAQCPDNSTALSPEIYPMYQPFCRKFSGMKDALTHLVQYFESGTDWLGFVKFYEDAEDIKLTQGGGSPGGMVNSYDTDYVQQVASSLVNHSPPSAGQPQIRKCDWQDPSDGEWIRGSRWYDNGFTNMFRGLEQAERQFQNPVPAFPGGDERKVAVLLTDGAPFAGGNREQAYLEALWKATELGRQGIMVVTIGLGEPAQASCVDDPYQNTYDTQGLKRHFLQTLALTPESVDNDEGCADFPSQVTINGNTHTIPTPAERLAAGHPLGYYFETTDAQNLNDIIETLYNLLAVKVRDTSLPG